MVDYQNGQLGQAVVRCVSKAIRHGADYAIIHHPDVVGIPVVEWWPLITPIYMKQKGN